MKRSKKEQETIILFNEEEKNASVYTHNQKWKERLKQLSDTFPKDCSFVSENGDGGETYHVTKKLVNIRTPYSEERKQRIRDQARAQNRKPPSQNGVATP